MMTNEIGNLFIGLQPGDEVQIGNDISLYYKKRSGKFITMKIQCPKNIKIVRTSQEKDKDNEQNTNKQKL